MTLSDNHWSQENYRQRMTIKEWRDILLAGRDAIIIRGHVRRLKADHVGAGVVEIYKKKEP